MRLTGAAARVKGVALAFVVSACVLLGARPAATTAAGAQRRVAPETVSVRVRGRGAVVVTERGRSHGLDLTRNVDAAKIEDASVLFRLLVEVAEQGRLSVKRSCSRPADPV